MAKRWVTYQEDAKVVEIVDRIASLEGQSRSDFLRSCVRSELRRLAESQSKQPEDKT